ncbi:MAG: hypothetical protein J4O07_10210 [Chloroflexi bacterium]|nr:hypothetical protein [Chloroflexota bacterium]
MESRINIVVTSITRSTIRTHGRAVRWLLIASLVTVLASCSGNGEIDGPVLTSPRFLLFGGGGTDADVGGILVFDENTRCLFLEHEEIENVRYPVIWPAGASWRADPPAVKLQGQLIEPGMIVLGGGGYHQHELIKEFAGTTVADAARACAGPTGEIAFFNIGSNVKVVAD